MAGVDARAGIGQGTITAEPEQKPTGRFFSAEIKLAEGGRVTVIYPKSMIDDFPGGREVRQETTPAP